MTVDDFIGAVHAEAGLLPFVTAVVVADRTDYAAKILLTVRPDLFVQMDANVETGTRGYALVYRGQRVYGRDCDTHGWHRHPAGSPMAHDDSTEGRRPVEVAEFLREVQDVLEEEGLL